MPPRFRPFCRARASLGHGVGISVEAAVADDGACSPIKVEDGCEGEVYAAGGQLRRQYPADLLGFFLAAASPSVSQICLRCHGGQSGEAFDEALYPAAFVIDGDDEFGRGAVL